MEVLSPTTAFGTTMIVVTTLAVYLRHNGGADLSPAPPRNIPSSLVGEESCLYGRGVAVISLLDYIIWRLSCDWRAGIPRLFGGYSNMWKSK